SCTTSRTGPCWLDSPTSACGVVSTRALPRRLTLATVWLSSRIQSPVARARHGRAPHLAARLGPLRLAVRREHRAIGDECGEECDAQRPLTDRGECAHAEGEEHELEDQPRRIREPAHRARRDERAPDRDDDRGEPEPEHPADKSAEGEAEVADRRKQRELEDETPRRCDP